MSRRWFQSKCIKHFVLIAFWVAASANAATPKPSVSHASPSPAPSVSQVPSIAATPSPSPSASLKKKKTKHASNLPKLLREVEDKYQKAGTVTAEFTQETRTAATQQKKNVSGKILIKRPNKVRWETLKPQSDANTFVTDGKKFWSYTPPFEAGENGQVLEDKASKVRSKLAQALLSGSFSSVPGMKIKKDTQTTFTLIPKKGTAGSVLNAKIEIDADKKFIQKVELEHNDGNKTQITLSSIELGGKIPDSTFVFDVPPNTDRLKAN